MWLPILESDNERRVNSAANRVVEERTIHYWDGDATLAAKFEQTLGIKQQAWDVYMLYEPGVKWGKLAPKPSYWMHQLDNNPKGIPFDGTEFAAEVKRRLEK